MFKKKVIIIDDQKIIRDCFELILNSSDKLIVIKTFNDGEQALKELNHLKPDIAIIDLDLPGITGIELIKEIKNKKPEIECLIVTVYEDSEMVFEGLRAGAVGYIVKSANYVEILNALNELLEKGAPMSPQIARKVITSLHINNNSPLSVRESEVLKLISQGQNQAEIAEELFIAKQTVRSHIRNIYQKLNVNSKSDAIKNAKKNNYI